MAKSLSQITFDFSTDMEVSQSLDETHQPNSQKEASYSLPKPPEFTEVEKPIEMNNPQAVEETEAEEIEVIKTTRGRRSLKNSDFDEERINIPDDEMLFQKHYYAIGEVATMFSVNASLLRYWENEFAILQPRKNKKGDRFFRPQDIKNLYLIFDLLRRRKFTIEGAKDYLKKNKKVEEKYELIQSMEKIKSFLLELKTQL